MTKSKNILLVVNPISGDSDKRFIIEKIKSKSPKNAKFEVYETSGKKDLEKISGLLKKKSPERVLVIGGDGTIKLVAEAIGDFDLPIGIVPAGSANGLANDLELPLEIEKAIPVAFSENTQKIDALCINGELGLHISDFGLNAELIKNYAESGFRGKFGYALNSVSALYNSEMPYLFKVQANGKTKTHLAIMLAFANSRKFGTGALVNPNGKIDDGKFEILVFKKFDILEIIKTLRGDQEMSPDFVETISTKKAVVTTSFPIDFQIDGEYCEALKKVDVEIFSGKLRIAVK